MPFGQSQMSEAQPYTTTASRGSGVANLFGAQSGWGSMSSAGPIGLFAALIAAGKMAEYKNPDSVYGRASLSLLGPSFNQLKADPKLAFLGPLGGIFRNDEAAKAPPEWSKLLGLR